MSEIKECPFCGGEGYPAYIANIDGEDEFFVCCECCACEGPWHKSESAAIHAWNTRALQPAAGPWNYINKYGWDVPGTPVIFLCKRPDGTLYASDCARGDDIGIAWARINLPEAKP